MGISSRIRRAKSAKLGGSKKRLKELNKLEYREQAAQKLRSSVNWSNNAARLRLKGMNREAEKYERNADRQSKESERLLKKANM